MDFKDFWPLVATRGRVAHFYQSECEHLWSTFSPAQQQAIYDAINEKLMAGKFVHYNPANAIRDNAPKAPKTLIISAEEYYRRYGTQTDTGDQPIDARAMGVVAGEMGRRRV